MTTRKLEQLNRHWRVLESVRNGRPYREIADAERISRSEVSRIAINAGHRRQAPKGKG